MTVVSVYDFTAQDFDNDAMPFHPMDYSHLKFGCDQTAKKFGYQLADHFFAQHSARILMEPTVVVPSPYNYVENAATVMTRHFVNRLNQHLVNAQGEHVDYSIIHRKVSYTHDYGFMSKEQRKSLISNDLFFLNEGFYEGKTLVFIDDIRITGTHEDRLRDIIQASDKLRDNKVFYLYYAQLIGEGRPEIEGALNFSGIQSLGQYAELTKQPGHNIIVRPIKFLLSREREEFADFLETIDHHTVLKIYNGCLGEGYYKIPDYQANFLELKNRVS